MIIIACLLLILLLALLAGAVFFANRLIEDSATHIPDAVRWLLRTCGDYWWSPPAAWVIIVVGLAFLMNATVGIAVSAAACVALAGFCWWTYRSLRARSGD